jgi:hypothetical protein
MWILIALAANVNGHVIYPEKFASLPACVAHVKVFRADLEKQFPTVKWRDISCYVTSGAGETA